MIPKIIHYCWFGDKKMPKLARKCIRSWKKYCPDYEIMCWNEENFDINSNQYVKEAYDNKKFAFVTDYVRLYALYNYGGIYMDTDVELIKSLDEFLKHKAFCGFESLNYIQTGIMAAEKENSFFKELLEYYADISFLNNDGSMNMTPNPIVITNILEKKGLQKNNELQEIDGMVIYPDEYFCPIDTETKKKKITTNTHCIHWFSGSWVPLRIKIRNKFIFILAKIIGKNRLENMLNSFKKR